MSAIIKITTYYDDTQQCTDEQQQLCRSELINQRFTFVTIHFTLLTTKASQDQLTCTKYKHVKHHIYSLSW